MKQITGKIALCGMLGALALVLAFLESLVPPLPMMPPGAKLGLSNLATMFAAGYLGLPAALFVSLLKGGFTSLTGGAVAGVMSLAGGLLSAAAAWFLLKKTGFSYIGVGVFCALTHNAAQLAVARLVSGTGILSYFPALVFFGVCSGALTGLLLYFLYVRLGRIGELLLKGFGSAS